MFVFLGVAGIQYLLNERFTKLSLVFTVLGLATSLICNFLFIPRLGVMGAAIATLVSYSVSGLFASFLFPATRSMARLQCLAIVSPWMIFRPGTFRKLLVH